MPATLRLWEEIMNTAMQAYIDLATWTKCAEGSQREIYQNPRYPDVLVKVLRSRGDRGARRSSRRFARLRSARRFGAYMTFRREIDEYLEQARKVNGNEMFDLPIPRIYGLAHTEGGLGLVVERIGNRDGKLSPTLAQLIFADRLTENHLRLVDRFFERCRDSHLVLMDINPGNFVITDRSGVEEIFCIDGTGEKQFFHLYAGSRLLNRVKLHFARRKLLDKIMRYQSIAMDTRRRQLPVPAHFALP
jgi:hypothetical protein